MRECVKCGTCYPDEATVCPNDNGETKFTLPDTPLLAKRYNLERRLGRGAMGQVYLARDENLGTRRVAVKTVRPDLLNSEDLQEGEAIIRFEREARAAASIRHPHVVDVTDFGKTEAGVFYLVMEYVKGETLHDLLRREGTLSTRRALSLLKQICEGVEAAHESGILHRDLKPANIFLLKTSANDDGFIKVGDFGLAKIIDQTVADISTQKGPASRGIIGTPEFMAPEQMQSETGVTTRADVYALGTIAYLMLGGRVPFTGDLMTVLTKKLTDSPPPLSRLRADIAPAVERAVMHALERDPLRRPTSVGEWREEFARAVESTHEDDDAAAGKGRVTVLAPVGAEVYVDDERQGSVGSSGKIILRSIAPGRHILRVSHSGTRDDEREIEIRNDSEEQVIQAVLQTAAGSNSQPTPSQSITPQNSQPPLEVVVCNRCNARFAAGVKFCGRCGGSNFRLLNPTPTAVSGNVATPQQINTQPSGANSRLTVNVAPNTMACPRCNKTLPANAKFCGGCGLNLLDQPSANSSPAANPMFNINAARPVEVVCGVCRASYPPGVRFCGQCGNPL